jgi:hypothetical protein
VFFTDTAVVTLIPTKLPSQLLKYENRRACIGNSSVKVSLTVASTPPDIQIKEGKNYFGLVGEGPMALQ